MNSDDRVVVGRIVSIHGVKGWVKVHSFTEPRENLFEYAPIWLKSALSGEKVWQKIEIDQYRRQGKALVAHIVGLDDRDEARQFCQRDIAVDRSQFAELDDNEFYWHQLVGLSVITTHNQQRQKLGTVKQLLETGANDVLQVKGDAQSLDRKERLIPYTDQFVLKIDLDAQEMDVDWDPEF